MFKQLKKTRVCSKKEQKGVKWKEMEKLPEATAVTHARRFAETSSWTHVGA